RSGRTLVEHETIVDEPLERLDPLVLARPRDLDLLLDGAGEQIDEPIGLDGARYPHARLALLALRAVAAISRLDGDEPGRRTHDARIGERRRASGRQHDLAAAAEARALRVLAALGDAVGKSGENGAANGEVALGLGEIAVRSVRAAEARVLFRGSLH